MPLNPNDYSTPGKILSATDDAVVFAPRGTTYELLVKTSSKYEGQIGTPVHAVIRFTARKVWTVPSGGNFVTPIIGTPRIIQGRVKYGDEKTIIVHAGANFIVDLPTAEHAVDLPNGPITVAHMVNVTALPGAMIEIVERHEPSASPA